MNREFYGRLIFELSHKGRKGYKCPDNGLSDVTLDESLLRKSELELWKLMNLLLFVITTICQIITSVLTQGFILSGHAL